MYIYSKQNIIYIYIVTDIENHILPILYFLGSKIPLPYVYLGNIKTDCRSYEAVDKLTPYLRAEWPDFSLKTETIDI